MTDQQQPVPDGQAEVRETWVTHRVADEWKEAVLTCACGWQTASKTKTQNRKDWLKHVSGRTV